MVEVSTSFTPCKKRKLEVGFELMSQNLNKVPFMVKSFNMFLKKWFNIGIYSLISLSGGTKPISAVTFSVSVVDLVSKKRFDSAMQSNSKVKHNLVHSNLAVPDFESLFQHSSCLLKQPVTRVLGWKIFWVCHDLGYGYEHQSRCPSFGESAERPKPQNQEIWTEKATAS